MTCFPFTALVYWPCCFFFLNLFGFLTSSSKARLYPGRVPRLTFDNFTCCYSETEWGDHDSCLSRSHYTDTDPMSRDLVPRVGIEPTASSPGVACFTNWATAPPTGLAQHVSVSHILVWSSTIILRQWVHTPSSLPGCRCICPGDSSCSSPDARWRSLSRRHHRCSCLGRGNGNGTHTGAEVLGDCNDKTLVYGRVTVMIKR